LDKIIKKPENGIKGRQVIVQDIARKNMTKQFPHLTTQIKGKTIAEQPFVFFFKENEDYGLIVFTDEFYSIIGKDKNGIIGLIKEKNLPINMKKALNKKALSTISKMNLLKKW